MSASRCVVTSYIPRHTRLLRLVWDELDFISGHGAEVTYIGSLAMVLDCVEVSCHVLTCFSMSRYLPEVMHLGESESEYLHNQHNHKHHESHPTDQVVAPQMTDLD